MQILAFFFFMIWVVAIIVGIQSYHSTDVQQGAALGYNWVIYRNSVVDYAMNNPGPFVGTIAQASLPLPPGYQNLGGWTNRVAGRTFYIYGATSPYAIPSAVIDTQGSWSVGFVQGGLWVSPAGGILGPAPPFVPNGDILSVVSVQ